MDAMERQEKIDFILEHFNDPSNYGRLDDSDIVQEGGNPSCGDVLTLYLKINDENVVDDISFEGRGCTLSQAAASMLTEIVKGKSIDDIEAMPPSTLLNTLGIDVAMTRPRCSLLALDTIKIAVKKYKVKKPLEMVNQD